MQTTPVALKYKISMLVVCYNKTEEAVEVIGESYHWTFFLYLTK